MGIRPEYASITIWGFNAAMATLRLMLPAIYRSFQHSRDGLCAAWRDDRSFRYALAQFVLGLLLATALCLLGHIGLFSWLLLIGATMPILIVETINTAIEAVTDKASPEHHPLAKKAKDIGSAAVLLTRIYAVTCWVVILGRAAA